MEERHYIEELRNIAKNGPLWPGDTISHETAYECVRRGWATREPDPKEPGVSCFVITDKGREVLAAQPKPVKKGDTPAGEEDGLVFAEVEIHAGDGAWATARFEDLRPRTVARQKRNGAWEQPFEVLSEVKPCEPIGNMVVEGRVLSAEEVAALNPFRIGTAIPREEVRSSNLRALGYLEDGGVLEAEFHDGSLYRYAPVRKDLFLRLMAAPSIGSEFRSEIVKVFQPRKILAGGR